MSKQTFIQRIMAIGRSEDRAPEESVPEVTEVQTAAAGEAALRPSITEILFQRREAVEAPTTRVPADEATDERRLSKREETAQKLSEGLENMSGLLKSINEKLDTGNERGMVLSESIDQLPDVLRSIPETNRAQIEFLGTISKQLDLQTSRTGELLDHLRGVPAMLKSLPVAQERQAAQLQEIAATLVQNSKAQRAHLDGVQKSQHATLAAFQSAQNKSLNVFHKAQQQSISMLKGSQDAQARQIESFLERTHMTMNRVLIACAAIVGAAALGVAAILVFA